MSDFSCQYAVTAKYITEFYPQNNFFPIHLQIVVFMGKWKCAFFKDLYTNSYQKRNIAQYSI